MLACRHVEVELLRPAQAAQSIGSARSPDCSLEPGIGALKRPVLTNPINSRLVG